jgi:hypothetical protein
MKAPVVRLALTAGLFVGWIGYLAYQVATRPQMPDGRPLVVSRPQVLSSDLDVVADVPSAEGTVTLTVHEVLYQKGSAVKEGDEIKVHDIDRCKARQRRGEPEAPGPDWTGPGPYLLPLLRQGNGEYKVAPVPESPGYSLGPPRLYPATPATRAQYQQIAKPE